MKRWKNGLKRACILAIGAMLLPGSYEMARETLIGWPRQEAAEGVIPDSLVIRKQGFDTISNKVQISSSWNSYQTGRGLPARETVELVSPSGKDVNQTAENGDEKSSGNITSPGSSASTGGVGSPQSQGTSGTGTRVIYSSRGGGSGAAGSGGNGQGVTGPGREDYSPIMTAAPPAGYLGGSRLSLLANQTASQMLSVLVETNQGKLVMVDGGTDGDAGYLVQVLAAKGGHVDTWLITHPHSDHIGALNYILNHPECGITIGSIYYSFADLSWYQQYEAYRADMVQQLMTTFAALPQEMLHGDIQKGQEIWVDNIKITVMNLPYLQPVNSINNSSVAYMLDINGKKTLFLGDMGEESGRQFIADNLPEVLKCDILQVAHHGQGGVSQEVYQILRPEICLWACPAWLWNNDSGSGLDSGSWKTLETRKWMAGIGVPYHVCIKDGDQVIQ